MRRRYISGGKMQIEISDALIPTRLHEECTKTDCVHFLSKYTICYKGCAGYIKE